MNLQILKEFLGWMTVVNLGLFIFTAAMSIWCRSFIYRIHGRMFGLEQNTISAMLYGFLAFYKIVFIVFVLTPWIALTIMTK
jgi:hypothetical protein